MYFTGHLHRTAGLPWKLYLGLTRFLKLDIFLLHFPEGSGVWAYSQSPCDLFTRWSFAEWCSGGWWWLKKKKTKKESKKENRVREVVCLLLSRRLAQDRKIKILYLLQCKRQPTCSSFLAHTLNHQATSPLAAAVLLHKKNSFEIPWTRKSVGEHELHHPPGCAKPLEDLLALYSHMRLSLT